MQLSYTSSKQPSNPETRLWKYSIPAFLITLAVSIFKWRASIITTPVRLLFFATFAIGVIALVLTVIRVIRRKPRLAYIFAALIVLVAGWFLTGERSTDTGSLRAVYISELTAFKGVPYVLGGETGFGIDCSGIARAALLSAMLKQGVSHRNYKLLGPALWRFWWRDLGANDLGEQRYGYTRIIGHADKLAGYDTRRLKPGDMAIASSSHVLIYLGNDNWIEANPGDAKVVINPAPSNSKRGWFRVPVVLVRWWILD